MTSSTPFVHEFNWFTFGFQFVECGGTFQLAPKLGCYLIALPDRRDNGPKLVEYEAVPHPDLGSRTMEKNDVLHRCGGTPHRGRNIWKMLLSSDSQTAQHDQPFKHLQRPFVTCNHCQGLVHHRLPTLETSSVIRARRACSSNCGLILSSVAMSRNSR